MTLKERILKEMLIDNDMDWALANEIYNENKNCLLPRIGVGDIYLRIKDIRKDPKSKYVYPYKESK